jgi:hypothetical protein
VAGHVPALKDREIVRFSAIAEEDEAQVVDTVWAAHLARD